MAHFIFGGLTAMLTGFIIGCIGVHEKWSILTTLIVAATAGILLAEITR